MDHHPCAFHNAIMHGPAHCSHGHEITRRTGPDIGCSCPQSSALCADIFKHLKSPALQALVLEDDLTQMPHSILVKIQCGGLLALQTHIAPEADAATVVDVSALASRTLVEYDCYDDVPWASFTDDMVNYKLPRRRRR